MKQTNLVEPSNSTVGQLISADTIDRVPLLNRDVFDLTQLSPGVTPANGSPNSSNSQSIASITSGRPGIDVSSYTINGAIVGSVYYMAGRKPAGDRREQCGGDSAGDGDSGRCGAGDARGDAEHPGVLPERRSGRDQPGEQVGHGQVSRGCVWGFPPRHAGVERVFQQAEPDLQRNGQYAAVVPSVPGRRSRSAGRFCTTSCSSSATTRRRSSSCSTAQTSLPSRPARSGQGTSPPITSPSTTRCCRTIRTERGRRLPTM